MLFIFKFVKLATISILDKLKYSHSIREYKEKRYILRWKPPLNLNKLCIMMELINNFLIDKFVFV